MFSCRDCLGGNVFTFTIAFTRFYTTWMVCKVRRLGLMRGWVDLELDSVLPRMAVGEADKTHVSLLGGGQEGVVQSLYGKSLPSTECWITPSREMCSKILSLLM